MSNQPPRELVEKKRVEDALRNGGPLQGVKIQEKDMVAEQSLAAFAAYIGLSGIQARELGLKTVPCLCGDATCKGFRIVCSRVAHLKGQTLDIFDPNVPKGE
jgi:hypothetical protein